MEAAAAKAGRADPVTRAAAEWFAVAAYRTVRRARRRAADTPARFPLRAVPTPVDISDTVGNAHSALVRLGASEADAASLLAPPPLPDSPPSPEDESLGAGGTSVPTLLPLSAEHWQAERVLQAAEPFVAGQVGEPVDVGWAPGLRPSPPPGHVLAWGRRLRLAEETVELRATYLRLIAKDLRCGALSPVSWQDVDVTTPVQVAFHPVTLKPRLIHDLRAVNCRMIAMTSRLPRASDALGLPLAAKLDLASAFRHVPVAERDKRALAFVVDGIPFRWNALPFGSAQSPALFAAALQRTLDKLPAGVRLVVYVDDVLILGESRDQLDASMLELMRRLRTDGWHIALEKTYPYAHGKIPFLGLLLDARGEALYVSRTKAERFHRRVSEALSRATISLHELQKITGALAFFGIAVPECRLGRRGLDAATSEAYGLPGRTVGVKGLLRADLLFWQRTALSLPDTPSLPRPEAGSVAVCTDAAGLPALGFGGVAWRDAATAPDVSAVLGDPRHYCRQLRRQVTEGGARVVSGALPATVASYSSTALEILACRRVLQDLVRAGWDLRGKRILWYSDSQAAVAGVARWRTRSVEVTGEMQELLQLVRSLGASLVPHWVSRELGWQPAADFLSKATPRTDSAEWSVPPDVFAAAVASAGWSPDTDLFATPANAVTERFCARFPTPGGWTDAFARDWSNLRAWGFPPFSAARATLRHAARARHARFLFLLPADLPVPARLHVVSRTALPGVRLVDSAGRQARGPCPVPLEVVHLASQPAAQVR